MTLKLSIAPTAEPVSLAEVKSHVVVEHSEDDSLLNGLIAAARQHVEHLTARQLITATWKKYLDAFPGGNGVIELEKPPIQAVTLFEYVDAAGVTQTLAGDKWQLDAESEPGRIVPAYGQTWPSTRQQLNAVIVTFTAGYGAAAAVPESAKQAILLLVAHWYEAREAVGQVGTSIELAFNALVWDLRWTIHA